MWRYNNWGAWTYNQPSNISNNQFDINQLSVENHHSLNKGLPYLLVIGHAAGYTCDK